MIRWMPSTEDHNAMNNRCDTLADNMPVRVANCIASACMAWRAGVFVHQRNLAAEDQTPGVGYCGAFGKPTEAV
jgi:hypothetical protein